MPELDPAPTAVVVPLSSVSQKLFCAAPKPLFKPTNPPILVLPLTVPVEKLFVIIPLSRLPTNPPT